MTKLAIFGILAASIIFVAFSAPANEKVDLTQLSQIPTGDYNFTVYSGYLFVDNTTNTSRSFHYVFVTSMNNPVTDPVLLWLNGGPGCSSMEGFINELGPFLFGPNSTQTEFNPYTWNANASVLFIESPVGVGFSNGTNLTYNDTFTAQDNLRALTQFFLKFPEYQPNDFYLSGESYGGIYIPSLAQAIHWANEGGLTPRINLKGLAVGNGVVQITTQEDAQATYFFLLRHNVVPYQSYDNFSNVCIVNYNQTACVNFVNNLTDYIFNNPFNPYDIYSTCYDDSNQTLNSSFQKDYARFRRMLNFNNYATFGDINPFADLPPCADVLGITLFFNNNTVKQAFHVDTSVTWSICSQTLDYEPDLTNLSDTYGFLLQQGYRVIYYSGDADIVCAIDNAEIFFKDLARKFNLPNTVPKTPWHIPGLYPDEPQTTGFYADYNNFRFISFMGVGHMVPQWNKPGGQKMITTFIHNLPLD